GGVGDRPGGQGDRLHPDRPVAARGEGADRHPGQRHLRPGRREQHAVRHGGQEPVPHPAEDRRLAHPLREVAGRAPSMAKWKLISKHEYEFIAAFPRYVMTLGGMLLGLLMTAGGVALLVFGTGGDNISNIIPAVIFGVLLVLFGLLIAAGSVVFWPWKLVRWVRVYEEGLRWQVGGREHKCRWEEVAKVNR